MVHPKIRKQVPFYGLFEKGYNPEFHVIVEHTGFYKFEEGNFDIGEQMYERIMYHIWNYTKYPDFPRKKGDLTFISKTRVKNGRIIGKSCIIEDNKYCLNFPISAFKIVS